VKAQALVAAAADVVVVVVAVAAETLLLATYAVTEVDSVQLMPVLVEATAVVVAAAMAVEWVVPLAAATVVARTATHLDQAVPARNHPGGKLSRHDNNPGFFAIIHCAISYWFL